MKRRDFLHAGALTAAGVLLAPDALRGAGARIRPASIGDAFHRDLAARGLDAARSGGAAYADIRFNTVRTRSVATREQRVTGVSDTETYGFGIRVLVGGTWGFAASDSVSADEVERIARSGGPAGTGQPGGPAAPRGTRPAGLDGRGRVAQSHPGRSLHHPIEEMVALLFETNAAALSVRGPGSAPRPWPS
jgi:TldD protein